jgi:hypothetical protein
MRRRQQAARVTAHTACCVGGNECLLVLQRNVQRMLVRCAMQLLSGTIGQRQRVAAGLVMGLCTLREVGWEGSRPAEGGLGRVRVHWL